MADVNNLEVYIYRGNKGEKVPRTVQKLIVQEGVQVLPANVCYMHSRLQKVTLPPGLLEIGEQAFLLCTNLSEISAIGNTVIHIGMHAFRSCRCLKNVEFECSTSSPHQLTTIQSGAFYESRLSRIKLPSSVNSLGRQMFYHCRALNEANLSTTSITNILGYTFEECGSLQTVSLPKTVEKIGRCAFSNCSGLVTVGVPLHSEPIKIGELAFRDCELLSNFLIPKDSTAATDCFFRCTLLQRLFGEETSRIVAGLMGRFENFPVHRMCYDHSPITAKQLRQCIADQQAEDLLVDQFGMTPFHVLFSTAEPRLELLEVLLDQYPYQVANLKDINGKWGVDYLINNWNDESSRLLQRTLQKSIMDPLVRWGSMKWAKEMKLIVGELLLEQDKGKRNALQNKAYSLFERYENLAATSVLELSLWKWKLKSGRTIDGTKRQALDREECRFLSGSNVVIPNVTAFLGVL